VTDVRVHAGERELDRVGVLAASGVEQRRPGLVHPATVEVGGVRGEELVSEAHVQPGEELAGDEVATVDRLVDQLGDVEVHPVEVGDPVVVAQVGLDGRHAVEDVGNRPSLVPSGRHGHGAILGVRCSLILRRGSGRGWPGVTR
jgi:hypothetical protein